MSTTTVNDVNVFVCMLNECAKYGWLFKGRFHYQTAYAVNRFLDASKMLQKEFAKVIDVEELSDVSEKVSVFVELLRKGDDKRFDELVHLINEWDAGNVKVVEDETINTEQQ